MRDPDVTTMLTELAESTPNDYAQMLDDLSADSHEGDEAYIAQVLAQYAQTIGVYLPTEVVYQSALQVVHQVDLVGIRSSTNR